MPMLEALTVLKYLVGNGSERVIDDMREHAYQISILSDFQYIDSSGRDQGHNVRKKSQALVALINDKRKDTGILLFSCRFQSTHSSRPDSYLSPRHYGDRYDHSDSRYASRDDDLYGNWKERDWGYKDDELMIEVSGLAIHMVDRKIVMVGTLMNVMAEMVIRMMSIEEVRKVLMVQEIQASVESVPLMMMTAQSVWVAELTMFLGMKESWTAGFLSRVVVPHQAMKKPQEMSTTMCKEIGTPCIQSYPVMEILFSNNSTGRNISGVKAAAPTAPSSVPSTNSPPQTLNQGSPPVPAASSTVKIENHGSGNIMFHILYLNKQQRFENAFTMQIDPRNVEIYTLARQIDPRNVEIYTLLNNTSCISSTSIRH
ncbi:hypothetical protein ZIOFF_033059 [Zingiber officinale]|uniref:ENTH domain-containing protein n=1 Tax=Zingiber officinale TaxID=94328 RepID=A0A8J5GPN4_ZINOF|nr:hypothetical protein ZIOFF_033059 [Zingiber officinale]